MIPAELAILETMPLSPNGKVDREAVKRLFDARADAPRSAEPPAGDLERRLAAIWEELLDVRGVGRGDGFFDLGGHSLLTVQLLARIERDLGRRLPLAALFRGATLASLAAEIRSAPAARVAPPLVPLREGGEGRPFFWFHALDGRTLCYGPLSGRLSGRPLYGLETEDAGASLEALAARYAEALAAAQPRGPYLLGGWSFGGIVAWETARRLEERGKEVALLVLIDSRPPDPAAAIHARLEALGSYRPGPVNGPVALFLAGDRPRGEDADLAALWRPLTLGGLDVETLPGDHFSLLQEPAVAALAGKIQQKIDLKDRRVPYGGESS